MALRSNFKKYISERKYRSNYFKALKAGRKITVQVSLERLLKVLNLTNGVPLPAFTKALEQSGLLAEGTSIYTGEGKLESFSDTIKWSGSDVKSNIVCTASYPDPFNEGETKTSEVQSIVIMRKNEEN